MKRTYGILFLLFGLALSIYCDEPTALQYSMKPESWRISGKNLTIEPLSGDRLKIVYSGGNDSATLTVAEPVHTAKPGDHIRAAGRYRIVQSEYGSMLRFKLNSIAQQPVLTMSGNRFQKPTAQSKPVAEADRFDFSVPAQAGASYVFNMMFYGNPQTVILEEVKVSSQEIVRKGRPQFSPEKREYDREKVEASLASMNPVKYELRTHPNRVELWLDGKAVSPAIYRRGPHYPQWSRYGLFRDAGIDLCYFFAFLNKASETHKMNIGNLWLGKDRYDFSKVADELRVIHSINPRARVIVILGIEAYEGWDKDYPEAVFTNAKGEKGYGLTTAKMVFYGKRAEEERNKKWNEEFFAVPSNSSEEFKNEVTKAAGAFTRFLEADPAGKIVCGIHVVGGADGQFFPLDRDGTRGEDHSPANKRAWQVYLRRIYGNDIAELRRAWGIDAADFDQPGIPDNRERGNDNSGVQPSQRGRDYNHFLSSAMADLRLAIFRAIKENSHGRLMTGAYYPPGTSGNYDIERMLNSPDVDFLIDIQRVTPAGSFMLRNKLYIGEVDMRVPDIMTPIGNYIFNRVCFENIVRQTVSNIVQREGGMFHLFDIGEAFYSNPETVRFFGKLRSELDASLDGELAIEPEIAVFNDYSMLAGCSYRSADHLWRLSQYSMRHVLEHSGIPFQAYMAADALNPALRLPKILFFPLIPDFSPEELATLRTRAKAAGSLIVWGYYRPFRTGPSATFGGYELHYPPKNALSPLRIADAENTGMALETIIGESYTVSGINGDFTAFYETPARIAVRSGDKVLAFYSNDRTPGMILREENGIREIINAAPGAFSPQFFRHLAKRVGAQILNENDQLVVMAENGMLSVFCERGGNIEVTIPKGFKIVSCLTGHKYLVTGNKLQFEAGLDNETIFFKLVKIK